jgi:hypothetical protein
MSASPACYLQPCLNPPWKATGGGGHPTAAMKITFIILAILTIAFFIVSPASERATAKPPPLPPRYLVETEHEARRLASSPTIEVLGTGSMRPYIPASADPRQVVAIADVEFAPYDQLKKGDLVIYRHEKKLVIHQIAARQGKSWITSGISNSYYDGPSVNRDTYHSRVVRVYVITNTRSGVAAKGGKAAATPPAKP